MVTSCDEAEREFMPIKQRRRKGLTENESVEFIDQFVYKIEDFSSQYGRSSSISYTAYNIAGIPRKFPNYGDFPEAFVMRTYGRWWDEAPSRSQDYMPQNNGPVVSHDFIDLKYKKEVYPVQVSIYEVYNPGTVVSIWARDEIGQWIRLWSGPPQIVPHRPRVFSPPLLLSNFKTKILRIEFNHSQLEYYSQLDAVQLIGTSEPINLESRSQNLSSMLRKLGSTGNNSDDCHNLTPDYLKVKHDLRMLMSTVHKELVLFKLKKEVPKTKSTANDLESHLISPIEEAVNSLNKFLQEDFPKLIGDIHISSTADLSKADSHTNRTSGRCICGSFSALPDETVLKIFKHLDLKSLSRCSQVNRHFNNIARDTYLYTSLNFKPYWYCVDATVLSNFTLRCQYLQRLDLSWCGSYDAIKAEDFIAFLRNSGSYLTHLKLNCCRFVNDAIIQEISQICRNLKELCLHNCMTISSSGFQPLETLENLERLELYRTRINTAILCSILQKNTNMRHLNLAGMHDRINMDEVAIQLSISCRNIESIDFWKSLTLTVQGIKALSNCTNLREIDIGWCGIRSFGDSLRVLLSSCKNLEKLFLTSFRNLRYRDLEALLLCQNLQQLDLLGVPALNGEICDRLLSSLPLRMIDVSFCSGITDKEICEWRRLYPHVSIKKSCSR